MVAMQCKSTKCALGSFVHPSQVSPTCFRVFITCNAKTWRPKRKCPLPRKSARDHVAKTKPTNFSNWPSLWETRLIQQDENTPRRALFRVGDLLVLLLLPEEKTNCLEDNRFVCPEPHVWRLQSGHVVRSNFCSLSEMNYQFIYSCHQNGLTLLHCTL